MEPMPHVGTRRAHGARPLPGRLFLPEDDGPGRAGTAVLNHGTWTRRFGADPSIVGGAIVRSVHIPGKLWPVNDWSLAHIDELFSINERVVTYIDGAMGRVAVVMVGATNVGKISVAYDSFLSNVTGTKNAVTRNYSPPLPTRPGDRLGTFHMGSSVVVLLEPGRIDPAAVPVSPKTKLRYGQMLI